MSKTLFAKMELAEARGKIPQGSAVGLTYATILEAGARATAEGYYGPAAVRKAESAARDEQHALDAADEILADIAAITRVYGSVDAAVRDVAGPKATHTTSDYPAALAMLRTTLRGEDSPATPAWRSWIPGRLIGTTPDFKPIRGVDMTAMGELKLRPEATDVQYTTIGFDTDHFVIANYERAVQYTWEMWLNDELSVFTRALRSLGAGAFRTEALVIYNALLNGVTRDADVTTGAPDAARIAKARQVLAARTVTDADGVESIGTMLATDIVYGAEWTDDVLKALGAEFLDFNRGQPNPVYGALTPHVERLWARVFGSDWLVLDNEADFIDVRFLEGFQGGPQTYAKMPDVQQHPDQGSFDNHSLSVKVGHTLGAKVTKADAIVRVQGKA